MEQTFGKNYYTSSAPVICNQGPYAVQGWGIAGILTFSLQSLSIGPAWWGQGLQNWLVHYSDIKMHHFGHEMWVMLKDDINLFLFLGVPWQETWLSIRFFFFFFISVHSMCYTIMTMITTLCKNIEWNRVEWNKCVAELWYKLFSYKKCTILVMRYESCIRIIRVILVPLLRCDIR